jgi:hypothetical protein
MGKLTDVVAKGDPLDPVSVVGFASDDEAMKFVEQGFSLNGLHPTFSAKLTRDASINYEGAPYAVFSYFDTSGVISLLSIIQLNGDLPNLNLGSWGAQMTLSR